MMKLYSFASDYLKNTCQRSQALNSPIRILHLVLDHSSIIYSDTLSIPVSSTHLVKKLRGYHHHQTTACGTSTNRIRNIISSKLCC